MTRSLRWTSADLEVLPDDGKRYEIIDGELYVSKQPHWNHQLLCAEIYARLWQWSRETGSGVANLAPGLIFAEDDDVVPDVVWLSNQRLQSALAEDGKLHASPDLVVEVLSPGSTNERCDREAKLKLYSRRGAQEYWIVDWQRRQIEVHRRLDMALELVGTLFDGDLLVSPLLPGFKLSLGELFSLVHQD